MVEKLVVSICCAACVALLAAAARADVDHARHDDDQHGLRDRRQPGQRGR